MNNLRQLCAAFSLTLVLTLPAFAGEITTGIATPSPSALQGEITTGYTGEISTTQIAINLLQSVLSLL